MKPLAQLINVEKARLLHQLFPEEIPAFLTYLSGLNAAIKAQEESSRKKWDNGLFTFDYWLSLIQQSEETINRYGVRLHKNSRLFADQLFDGHVAIYMIHGLQVYTTTRKHPNQKFVVAVDLLFNL